MELAERIPSSGIVLRPWLGTLGFVLTVRPTKMLARQLGIVVPADMPTVPSRVADWCAHSFTFGRRRWLIF